MEGPRVVHLHCATALEGVNVGTSHYSAQLRISWVGAEALGWMLFGLSISIFIFVCSWAGFIFFIIIFYLHPSLSYRHHSLSTGLSHPWFVGSSEWSKLRSKQNDPVRTDLLFQLFQSRAGWFAASVVGTLTLSFWARSPEETDVRGMRCAWDESCSSAGPAAPGRRTCLRLYLTQNSTHFFMISHFSLAWGCAVHLYRGPLGSFTNIR